MSQNKITPMMRQFQAIKEQHPDKILFYRLGDFYEMFGQDAITAAEILQIQLTSRSGKDESTKLPMCGVPAHSMQPYLRKLVLAGNKVAICDQLEDPATVKGIVKRGVVRIITPGTLFTEENTDPHQSQFIAALAVKPDTKTTGAKTIGIAFCDLSTGDFEVEQLGWENFPEVLSRLLHLYAPIELLHPEQADQEAGEVYAFAAQTCQHTQAEDPRFSLEKLGAQQCDLEVCRQTLERHLGQFIISQHNLEDKPALITAAGALINYLIYTQQGDIAHLKKLRRIPSHEHMILDETSARNLEIYAPIFGTNRAQTLFAHLNRCKTPHGARLLRKWLGSPLLDVPAILERQNAVEEMAQDYASTSSLRALLRSVGDFQRFISRASMPHCSVADLVKLRNVLRILPEIMEHLQGFDTPLLVRVRESCDLLADLRERFDATLQETPNLKLKEGGYIAEGFSDRLDEYRRLALGGKQLVADLEAQEREKSGIGTLRVKFHRVFGYCIEVPHSAKERIPAGYIRKQTLANAERYITDELKQLEERIVSAEDQAITLEQEIFDGLRAEMRLQIEPLLETSEALAHFDLISTFAVIKQDNRYHWPSFYAGGAETQEILIEYGRHPVVEALNAEQEFIANSTQLGAEHSLMLITGPNMGGKSTYMRQIALIALMAQIGCAVPARSAVLPVFDRIFTRIGASDNLAQGQSTFMVEMNEVSAILAQATPRSLVILDEIGRGTSTFDGIGLAWAIAEFLLERGCLTFFATHYHELTLLADQAPEQKKDTAGACNYHVSVAESTAEHIGEIAFLRKIKPGKASKSYGVQVAKLAGLPAQVIEQASRIRSRLEQSEINFLQAGGGVAANNEQEEALQNRVEGSLIAKTLEEIDLNHTTPLEALHILQELKALQKRL